MRYTKQQLENVIKESISYSEALRKLGKSPVGGSISNISLRCKRLNIDVSHMLGQAHGKGTVANNRKTAVEHLVLGTNMDRRLTAEILRRAMIEVGIPYSCTICGLTEWMDTEILEVDHVDNRYWNNTKENLQFMCPNCHTVKTKQSQLNKKEINASLSQLAEEVHLECTNVSVRIRQEVPKFTKEELEELVWILPKTGIAKMYNMSDNGIARWIRKWNIQMPPRGYFISELFKNKNSQSSINDIPL